MTNRFDVLTRQLFQKNIVDCSVEELENLADENPYFAPAQYALLNKLKEKDYDKYQAQFQKAILYYHDPLSFDQFINEENYSFDFANIHEPEIALPIEVEKEIQENLETVNTEEPEPVFDLQANEEVLFEAPLENEIIIEEAIKEINNGNSEKDTIKEEQLATPVIATETSQPATGLVFEPYYTVDYFASQGIKLSQEEAPKDKFGKQLKSFTEWLKTMKKLPVSDQVKPLDIRSEQNVENLAAHSLDSEEVYTETMAEVWSQQGNNEKAIEIYNKLSLINPSKRAYFAAKIDSLK
jgi:tetratricopeptide (TPR) repeat protein